MPGGAEEPQKYGINATWMHFGHPHRRLHMGYGINTISGPCCDVGWYLRLNEGPVSHLMLLPEMFPTLQVDNEGLVLGTSFLPGASVNVTYCKKKYGGKPKECLDILRVHTVAEVLAAAESQCTAHVRQGARTCISR
eukprot:3827129-Rhodomonas_salina.2